MTNNIFALNQPSECCLSKNKGVASLLNPRTLLVLLAFTEKNIVRYFTLALSMIPIVGVVSSYIVPFLYVVLFFAYLFKYKIKIEFQSIIFLGFVLISILSTCLFFIDNTKYFFTKSNIINTVVPCFKYFLIGLLIIPDKETMELLGKASCLAVLVETLFLVLYMIPHKLVSSDDMNRSYQLLANVLLVINYAINKKKIVPWLFAIIGIIYTLALGTRGPLLIIFVFFVLKVFLSRNIKKRTKVVCLLAFVMTAITFLSPSISRIVLPPINSILSKIGLSTRILDSFLYEKVSSGFDSGRGELYSFLLEKIKESPIYGYGVYGEWQWIGWNAHNIFIEIFIHYGLFIGTVFLLWLVYIIFGAFIKTNNDFVKDLIVIWFCLVFVRGIIGGSYFSSTMFFLIGFCIKEKAKLKTSDNQRRLTF